MINICKNVFKITKYTCHGGYAISRIRLTIS